MVQSKQPVIQSLFDRKLLARDDAFFLKAIDELEGYRRELAAIGPTTSQYEKITKNRGDRVAALDSVYAGMFSAENVLRGVLRSFDVLSEESIY